MVTVAAASCSYMQHEPGCGTPQQSFWKGGIIQGMLLDFPHVELHVSARDLDYKQSVWFCVAKHTRKQRGSYQGFPALNNLELLRHSWTAAKVSASTIDH